MAVLAIFTGNGIDKAKYEAVRKEVDWEHQHPAGGILHAAAFDEQGNARVADIWASQEELDAFVATKLGPTMQKLNISPPDVQVYPLHNINAYPAVDQFKVS